VTDEWLNGLRKMTYARAKDELMTLPGVGPKVADCVLLFSLGFPEAFPVDVWVRRTMTDLFFDGRKVSDSDIRAFAAENFGEFAGWAQEYLFVTARLSAGRM
jgi:N-glycosylase/DNA lyase